MYKGEKEYMISICIFKCTYSNVHAQVVDMHVQYMSYPSMSLTWHADIKMDDLSQCNGRYHFLACMCV